MEQMLHGKRGEDFFSLFQELRGKIRSLIVTLLSFAN